MVIDLSQFDFKKKPTLILRNPDGTAIGVLGTAYNIKLDPHYNEVSSLEFDLSAYDAAMRTPHYDQVIGLRIVDLKGIGQFVLNSPKTTSAGAWEAKHCTAYSLEREFVRKNVYLEKNVYHFWDPVSPEGTVLGIIMEKFPNWSIGKVDSDLIGKYRSLDDTDDNAYNVMKSTLQEAYGCIFDFDTYKRKVNVVSAASDPTSLPVFFSLDNLIKQLEIEEDDENIATCLGAYGADGLSIADVNPMGGAKLYNFDYFMNETNFAPGTIERYKSWKDHFKAQQEPFYNLTVEQALKESQAAAEGARLTDLQGELKALEGVQATWVELLASHDYSGKTLEDGTPADEAGVQKELDKVNGQIRDKRQEISNQQAVVDGAKAKAEQLQVERKAIVDGCQFEAFFTAEEILQLDHYITENSIEESSFVASEVKNYNAKDTSLAVSNAVATLTAPEGVEGAVVEAVQRTNGTIYSLCGGRFSLSAGDTVLDADAVRVSVEVMRDKTFTLSAYLNRGTLGATAFPGGTVVLTGESESAAAEGAKLTLHIKEARFYFTQNLTEWERRSVAWDLFQYGQEVLEKVAQPSYSFTVEAADFLVMDEFEAFKNALSLGNRVYLKLDDGRVLTPLLLGFSHTFDEKSGLTLEFSNKFTSSNENDRLVDLLEQSVSMGKKLDLSREIYAAFVDSHANTAFDNFYSSSIDMAMHDLFVSNGWSWTLDENGLRMRQPKDGSTTEFEPEQLWMNGRSIMFTDDGWQTAKMGIGKIVYPNSEIKGAVSGSMWGVIAPNLVGEGVIGKTLAFYCPDESGGAMQFRFDSEGLYSYNAHQYWRGESGGFALLDPDYGFMLGTEGNPLIVGDDGRVRPSCIDEDGNVVFEDMGKYSTKKIPKGMNLYMGVDGSLHMRGDFYANDIYVENGTFNGTVYADKGRFTGDIEALDVRLKSGETFTSILNEQGKIKGDYIDAKGIHIKDPATGDTVLYMDATGIHWTAKYSPFKYQYATSATGPWHDTRAANDEYRRESTDGGTTWSDGIKFVAKDGRDGSDGSDASVTFDNMLKALQKAESTKTSFMTADEMGAPTIYGAKIYGAEIYAGGVGEKGGQILALTDRGIEIWNGHGKKNVTIGQDAQGYAEIRTPEELPLTLHGHFLALGANQSVWFNAPEVDFTRVKSADFTGVETKGLHFTLA